MKDYNRRDFLKSALIASGTYFFSFSSVNKLFASGANNNATPDNNLTTDIKLLQKKAKGHFYAKEYANAELSYRQLILMQPLYIAAYDGLAKTLYAQNKSLAAAEAYRQGWLENKDNPLFSDRMARAMKRLVAGNSKQEKEFCSRIGQSELLDLAAQIYINAIEKTSKKPIAYLTLGLLDVQQTLTNCNLSRNFTGKSALTFSNSVKSKIATLTAPFNDKWETTRKKRKKKEYNVKNESEAQKKEDNSKNRIRRTLQFDAEKVSREKELRISNKRLYFPLFYEAIKGKSTPTVERIKLKLLTIEPAEPNVVGQMIRYYRKQKEYAKLVQARHDLYTQHPDFWNTAAYAQALRLQAKKELRPSLYSAAYNLYQSLEAKPQLSSREYLCVYGGQLDCLMQLKQFAELRTVALKALSPYPLSILPFVLVYIKSWIEEGKLDLAEDAFKTLISGAAPQLVGTNPISDHLKICFKILSQPTGQANEVPGFGVKKETLFDIYYAMYGLYDKKNDSSAKQKILNSIKQIDPNNDFIKKRGA